MKATTYHHICVVVEGIMNNRRECAKGRKLYKAATNESRKSKGLFLSLP
jgi:hypothetical protein